MRISMSNHLTKHCHMESKMRIVTKALLSLPLICSTAWAVELVVPTTIPAATAQAQPANTVATAPAMAVTAPAATSILNNPTTTTNSADAKPLTAEQIAKQKALNDAKVKALVKDQAHRLEQLEKANLDALTQNQELQLQNDNLGVQIQVLQSERSAQMFIYGAATVGVGIFCGFLIASYIYTKRRRQW